MNHVFPGGNLFHESTRKDDGNVRAPESRGGGFKHGRRRRISILKRGRICGGLRESGFERGTRKEKRRKGV